MQAETIAQSAERGGKKVAQIEWAGGRVGAINGPTVDFRAFFSGRGVATNYISPTDDAAFVASFGLQFDHPAGFAGQAAFAGGAAHASGWTNVRQSYSPAKEMRLRVLDFGTDKYGLNAYIFDSTNDRRVNYDRVLFSPTKDGANAVADAAQRVKWGDVKVKIVGGALDGLTAGMLVKVEELTANLSPGAPLPHLRLARERELAGLVRARLHRRLRRVRGAEVPHLDRRRLRDPRSGHRQRGDVRRAGPLLGDGRITRSSSTSSRSTSQIWRWSATRRPTSSSTSSWGS